MRLDELLSVSDVSALVCRNLDAAVVVRMGLGSKTLQGVIWQRKIIQEAMLRMFPGINLDVVRPPDSCFLFSLRVFHEPDPTPACELIYLVRRSIDSKMPLMTVNEIVDLLMDSFLCKEGRKNIIETINVWKNTFATERVFGKREDYVEILDAVAERARSGFFFYVGCVRGNPRRMPQIHNLDE